MKFADFEHIIRSYERKHHMSEETKFATHQVPIWMIFFNNDKMRYVFD